MLYMIVFRGEKDTGLERKDRHSVLGILYLWVSNIFFLKADPGRGGKGGGTKAKSRVAVGSSQFENFTPTVYWVCLLFY